ncbi:CidA/LrgA family protein [Psychrobacter sanguinis]|uniref:CidA/LrgA family protein n=1 Tax=Psychrobacter sanguinis TaxID=861445 RepID=UPI002A75C9FC|nr:CidA/LrgA family protein [Psychrobacter sanguinis]MDY3306474.1 CidA/LrgA family protein [Psychrobacter sanguinis]
MPTAPTSTAIHHSVNTTAQQSSEESFSSTNQSNNPSDNQSPTPNSGLSLPMAILLTLAVVVVIRESALVLCQALGFPSAANIVGMITLFVLLMVCRFTVGIPEWISNASNTLLVDSGFAFLPVSAGAGLLIFGLGDELWGVVLTIVVSTLIPLWGLAKLSNLWLKRSKEDDTPINAESSSANKSTTTDVNLSNHSKK